MMRLSIRWRIAIWNAAAFAVVLVAFGVAVYWLLRETHYEQIDRRLVARREALVARSADDSAAESARRWLAGGDAGALAYVLDRDGRVVEQTANLPREDEDALAVDVRGGSQFDSLRLPTVGHVRRLATRLPGGGQTLVLFAELEHVDEEMGLVLRTLLITAPVALLGAVGLAYFLAYKALAPVQELRRLTNEITADRLDRRLPVHNRSDELGLLAETINSMIARLERSFHEVRRFTADASHELRTPVSIIRSEAELALSHDKLPDSARRRFESIVEECARLGELTGQLLALCRDEAGATQAARVPVALGPLIAESCDAIRPLADAKRQRLDAELRDDPITLGNADRLRQMCRNLLQNAVKYTPADGTIHVALKRSEDGAELTVQDTGIGIAPEHVPHVFERFYQVAPGRSQDGGAGLGLSIVKSIVDAHQGRIEVESVLGAGALFRVVLPLAPADRARQSAPQKLAAESHSGGDTDQAVQGAANRH